VERLLTHLIALTVRYQTVGAGRTGQLETTAAVVARGVAHEFNSPQKVWTQLRGLLDSDDDFLNDWRRYSETKPPRAHYILDELERALHRSEHPGDEVEIGPVDELTVEHVLPKNPSNEWQPVVSAEPEIKEDVHKIGNLCLLAGRLNRATGSSGFRAKADAVYAVSKVRLTARIAADFTEWTRASIAARQEQLGHLALLAWPLS
jgi:hypothetical protein